MKKIFPLLLLVILMAACQKDPDLSDLNDDYVVYTDYDEGANFQGYKTFYIPDSVIGINNNNMEAITTPDAQQVLRTFIDNMTENGYTQVSTKDSADLGVMVTYVEKNNVVPANTGSWWWNYPTFNNWWNNYWGGYWDGWYYPYEVYYTYQVGSILAQIADLTTTSTVAIKADGKIPVIWVAYMTGLLYQDKNDNGTNINTVLATEAIDQAFEQTKAFRTSSSSK